MYAYRESEEACFGYDTAVVKVMEASAVIEFPRERTRICRNERPVTIKGINLNNTTGRFTISGDIGLTDNKDNTATIYPYGLGAGEYTVTYTYVDGATFSVKKTFEIGEAPLADFRWESECFEQGQSITFKNTSLSTFGNIESFLWIVKADGRTDTLSSENIEYTFPGEGMFDISLSVGTSYGCSNAISKTIGLSSTIKLAGNPYLEDFEDSSLFWHPGNVLLKPVNSWVLGDTAEGFQHATSGHLFWHTQISSSIIAPAENSWITSPCFDFSGTEKPMVILDIWRKFNNLRDGAVIQASADSGQSWMNIGELDDGINWFNSYAISGKPGGQSVGWSGTQDI